MIAPKETEIKNERRGGDPATREASHARTTEEGEACCGRNNGTRTGDGTKGSQEEARQVDCRHREKGSHAEKKHLPRGYDRRKGSVRGECREAQQERAARREHKKEDERDEESGHRRRLTPKQCCVRAQEEGDTAATGRRLVA